MLTPLVRYMRPLIKHGHVHIVQPPPYLSRWSGVAHKYVFSDRERDAMVTARPASGKRVPKDDGHPRYKGPGEVDCKELWPPR